MTAPAVTRGRRLERARIVRLVSKLWSEWGATGQDYHQRAAQEILDRIAAMPKPKGSR